MAKVKDYRYVDKIHTENMTDINIHVREMIEMLKHETPKTNLYVKGIKLSNHAFKRVTERLGIENLATATKYIKDLLKKATRVGLVVAYDGRLNVLYAHEQIGVYLSPDLKTVVTVNVHKEMMYPPAIDLYNKGIKIDDLITFHKNILSDYETKINKDTEELLKIVETCEKNISYYKDILRAKWCNKKRYNQIVDLISQNKYEMKKTGKVLLHLKFEHKQVAMSLVALL